MLLRCRLRTIQPRHNYGRDITRYRVRRRFPHQSPPLSPHELDTARGAASPRFAPPRTPWRSVVIHGGVLALWLVLFARAFGGGGLLAWAVGLVYVGYDTALQLFTTWQCRTLLRPLSPEGPEPRAASALAVIVAARNEAAVLPVTLAALLGQQPPPDLIVVADDGSDDETATMLRARFGLELPPLGQKSAAAPGAPSLRWLRLLPAGKPVALNAALLSIDAPIVVTVDADTLLQPGALAAMRRAFAEDPKLVAATGILEPVCGRGLVGRVFQGFQRYEYVRNFLSRYAWMRADGLLLISGAFAAFRTQALRDVGGFDPDCLVEDYELIHRLRRHAARQGLGWRTAVVGRARAVTDAPGSIAPFLRQRRRWFGGFLQTQLWYREMVGNPRYGRLGRWMLPVKAADTLQPVYGLTAFAVLVTSVLRGDGALALGIVGIMGAKLGIDLAYHLWSLRLYHRWTGAEGRPPYATGLLAALVEPVSFQLLRHLGATLGWVTMLTGGKGWHIGRRAGVLGAANTTPPDGTA